MSRFWAVVVLLVGALVWVSPAGADGDAVKGKAFAEKHCSRCHVVGGFNPHGGIDSTPSFQLLVRIADYRERFETFYARRPHPVVVKVPGVPPWTDLPAFVTQITVTPDDIENILAFAETLKNQ